ncbi:MULTISPECIES: hypothetical protein [unclassified Mesorhizobium]|uniref:hypothetical protein n=1 Tax=unclassified Mesorhizobium TaxID=325217 RepID=UPI0003CF4FD9|nr:hypothetical protein [Mesorhizobium sp. LSHC420B00]ESX62681.1 hypothetical protein X759_34430 [Mesorhizobium sp. LSHC420B00]
MDTSTDHLLLFDIDFDSLKGEVIFKGPEKVALAKIPVSWIGQRPVAKGIIRAADKSVDDRDRLGRIDR